MKKIPSIHILGRRLTFETAKRERRCRILSHTIMPSEQHLAIYQDVVRENYCLNCAKEKLETIENSFEEFHKIKEYFHKIYPGY
jgi:hypothetical protein